MRRIWKSLLFIGLGFVFLNLAACAAETVVETTIVPTAPPTQTPSTAIPPATSTAPIPTPTPFIEERFIEVEWPTSLNLGDSDIIRLALIPTTSGYVAQLEYPEHTVELEDVEVPYLSGYEAMAIARMDAVGMDFQPTGDQAQNLVEGQSLSWRWTIYPQSAGRHRLSLNLTLRWDPLGERGPISEVPLWQTGLEVIVESPFGLTAPQARALGIAGILVGSVLVLPFAEFAARQRMERARARRVRRVQPNKNLELEVGPGISLSETEVHLLQGLFENYARVVVETRYSSGYSGARTLLVQPYRSDGRADAHAIVKIGSQNMIKGEYANFLTFVRQTLPPITGRVLGPPVVVPGEKEAALQYTFVGIPSAAPVSLKSFSIDQSFRETATLIEDRLFSTFGPAWWMQRRPCVFRMGREYDRLFPVHLLLERTDIRQEASVLSGDMMQIKVLTAGDVVRVENAVVSEVRSQRETMTLTWPEFPGGSSLRVRFGNIPANLYSEGRKIKEMYGRVIATRQDLIYEQVAKAFPNLDLTQGNLYIGGRQLINPLKHIEELLGSQLQATCSVIHGDLNLENILIGPGNLVWLIDFAATREGHTLYDFARLEVELTTQVLAEGFQNQGYKLDDFLLVLEKLAGRDVALEGYLQEIAILLDAVRSVAKRCSFDPADEREFRKALILAYLGSLKFTNLDELSSAPLPKTLAFAASAYLVSMEKR